MSDYEAKLITEPQVQKVFQNVYRQEIDIYNFFREKAEEDPVVDKFVMKSCGGLTRDEILLL